MVVIPVSFTEATVFRFPPQGFSLQWYAKIRNVDGLLGALWLSAQIAALSTATALLLGTLWAIRPAPQPATPAAAAAAPAPARFADVQSVMAQRCVLCHGAALQSKNVRLDSAADLSKHAQMVYQQVVVLKQMPMNNATGLTEAERALIGEWFKAGAKTH